MSAVPAEDELDRIRRHLREAERAVADHRRDILKLLRAPYMRMSPYVITEMCVKLDHPSTVVDRRAKCFCGKEPMGWMGWEKIG